MSYLSQLGRKPSNPRSDHDKIWKREVATTWDPKWQALSVEARHAYLYNLKPPSKAIASPQHGILLDRVPAKIVDELVKAGFARIEPGKKVSKIFAEVATHDFSLRLRALDRYRLLGPTDRTLLTNFVKFAFFNPGDQVIAKVLASAEIEERYSIDEALELYVTTSYWPGWAIKTINSKPAAAVMEALKKATGPLTLAQLPSLVKGVKANDVQEATTDLVTHLAAFEGLEPTTLEITLGLLPIVRERLASSSKSDQPSPLVACEHPREIGPPGGLAINDLRVFLLEVAGEGPRLKQDGTIFAKEVARFHAALPPLPDWLGKLLKLSPERRLSQAFQYARSLGFTESEIEEKTIWMRLSPRGRKWLSSSLEEQYVKFYDSFRDDKAGGFSNTSESFDEDFVDDDEYDDYYDRYRHSYYGNQAESRFFGVGVSVHKLAGNKSRYYTYYTAMDAGDRKQLRASVFKAFESLPASVYHRWDSVLAHLSTARRNPLILGGDLSKLTIFVNERPVPRLPEPLGQASRFFLEAFLLRRLIPFDAVRPAIDQEGQLCIARLPRLAGYFGQPYDPGKDEISASTRVIVQPDFSVLIIGLDPAPAVELAPFCDRSGGHAGQGALTFKISRESVVRAATQGLNAKAILSRLAKYASIEIPKNVIREIEEWAGWVRQVNVRPVTVIRCPDAATVARVVAVLGKKAERLGETMVALHSPNLGSAERHKLQDQGILITKQDIAIIQPPLDVPEVSLKPSPTAAPAKKRGRPKKVR